MVIFPFPTSSVSQAVVWSNGCAKFFRCYRKYHICKALRIRNAKSSPRNWLGNHDFTYKLERANTRLHIFVLRVHRVCLSGSEGDLELLNVLPDREIRCLPFLISIGAALVLAGCATTPSGTETRSEMEHDITPIAEYNFVPANPFASIAAGEARYRNLYAPESYALWVTDEVAQAKRDRDENQGITPPPEVDYAAEVATNNFIVIECRLESEFADSSIAYDAVGMRNVEVYLEREDGEQVQPLQRIMGAQADETPVRALVRFGRTTVLVFPRSILVAGLDREDPPPTRLRLVLNGYHSEFYFPWVETEHSEVQVSATSSAGAGFVDLFTPLRRLVEIID